MISPRYFYLFLLFLVSNLLANDPLPVTEFKSGFEEGSVYAANPAQWYTFEVASMFLPDAPPGNAFIMEDLPEAVKEMVRLRRYSVLPRTTFYSIDGIRVTKDPSGIPLKTPFTLGDAVYLYVEGEQEQGIAFTYYFFKSNDIKWLPSKNPEKSAPYGMKKLELSNSLMLPPGQWYVQITNERKRETIEDSKAIEYIEYEYLFMRIYRGR